MLLFLVQHGQPLSENINPQKPLSDQGIADCEKVAAFAEKAGVMVKAIYHSDKPRAVQTAKIFAGRVLKNGKPEFKHGLQPMDNVTSWAEIVNASHDNLMLVGHLPFMERISSLLLNNDPDKKIINFMQGGLVCLERDAAAGQWFLAFAVTPDLIK